MTAKKDIPAPAPQPASVPLETPIKRGDTTIASVMVRKPQAAELRGVSLQDLVTLEVTSLIRVLPRVTVPTLLQQEVEQMDPADLLALGAEVVGFLMPAAAKESLGT